MSASLAAIGVIFIALNLLPPTLPVLYVGLVLWAFSADLVWPSQQRRMVELEPRFRGLALALTASFMFTGIATGSALGGYLYPRWGGSSVLFASATLCAAALVALKASQGLRKTSA